MTTIQYLHITFEAWSALFCLISAVCVIATLRSKRRETLSLFGLLITNAALNIAEALAYYYRGNTGRVGFFMTRISNFTVFFCNHLLPLFMIAYLCHVINNYNSKRIVKTKRVAYIIITAGILLLIFSRIFGFYYAFDEQNRYYRLDSYWLMPILSEVAMVILMGITFANWKHLRFVEKIGFLMFEFLPLAAAVVQLFVYGISITTIVSTISILMVFLTYELGYTEFMVQKEHKLLNQMISAFAQAIDEKDSYTGGHSSRVAKYSRMLSERMGLGKKKTEQIYQMALLHDIGKIGIPDFILRKNTKLSDEEYGYIKEHPAKGSEILDKITEMPELSIGARWHHERIDGKGYPDGITGDEIPIEARIICMADSYDAMTSNRSYRPFMSQEKVRNEIVENAGTQFDPEVAQYMLEIIDEDTEYALHE